MTEILIPMTDVSADRRSYGILYRSRFVYRMTGRGLHNPTSPHRLKEWDNTARPNLEPDRWTEMAGKPGPGKYLDPHRKGTDALRSWLFSAECTVIDRYGSGTGTEASGQVYGPVILAIHDAVRLEYPDGSISEPFTVTPGSLSDPFLVPVD